MGAPSRRLLAGALLVGVGWLAVWAAFVLVRDDGATDYLERDDGVITLSHARGLVDVGTVSVDADGARVEGFSAPLQFGLATIWFAAGGTGPGGFSAAQIVVSTILLGGSYFVLVTLAAPAGSTARRLLLASLAAVPVFASYRFFGWHSSGMENAVTNALVAVTLALLGLGLRRDRCLWLASISAGLLAVSRVEFAFHVVPVLAVAALLLARRRGSARPLVELLGPAAVIVVVVHAARFVYFGSLVPNSGIAQRLEPVDNLRTLAVVLLPAVGAALAIAAGVRTHRRAGGGPWPHWWLLAAVLGFGGSMVLFAQLRGAREIQLELSALGTAGVWPWVFVIAALAVATRPRLLDVEWLALAMVTTGAVHMVVFGRARLSDERVVTFLIVPLSILAFTLAARLDVAAVRTRVRSNPALPALVAALLGAGVIAVVMASAAYRQETLCCRVDEVAHRIERIADGVRADQRVRIVRVANADLGVLSLRKDVDVTDLGFLGDPVLAALWAQHDRFTVTNDVVRYLNEVARPDVVELHGGWACQYAPWLRSRRFEELYVRVDGDEWPAHDEWCDDFDATPPAVWVRRDLLGGATSPELALSRRLQDADAPEAGRLVAAAMSDCMADRGSWRCAWVGRAIARNVAALDGRGALDRVAAGLATSPTVAYDRAVLDARHDGTWHRRAVEAIEPLLTPSR